MRNRRLPRASELPNLTAFVRAYLHEDVVAEHGTATGAADAFARDASSAERQALTRELERVVRALDTRPAAEVTRFFSDTLRAGWTPSSRQELRLLIAKLKRGAETPGIDK
jgi:hypothetical protein